MTYVLLHGWGGSKKSMESLAELFASNGDEVIAYDLPGFGSESNPPSSWGIDEYADFVEDKISIFMSKVQNPKSKVTLIGHSFGGAIALKIASRHPNWLKKLVVMAPSWKRSIRAHGGLFNTVKSIFEIFPIPLKRLLFRIVYPKSDMYKQPELLGNYKKIMQQDLTDDVKKIALPTLILWGGKDDYVPVSHGELLQNNILDSKFKILPDGRHGLPFQNPQWIVEQMKKYGFL